jgi:glutamine synthetase type III
LAAIKLAITKKRNQKMVTIGELAQALPGNLKVAATQQLADKINNISADPTIAEMVKENFLSYTAVLKDGRFKTEDYLNAVVYVGYKLMNMSNLDAYQRTFPQRYQTLVAKGTSSKDISAYVAAYAKGKLVNTLMEQTLVPTWVLNQDVYQKAINVQAELMATANSEKVRCDAANSILTHLAKPKEAAAALRIDVNVHDGMNELKDLLGRLAEQQRAAIESGVGTAEIAAQPLIEGKATVVIP